MISLRNDSRDLHYYQHFGQVDFLPEELNFDRPALDYVQAPGDTRCTAITGTECAYDFFGVPFDTDELYRRIPHDSQGANVRDALTAIVNGLTPFDGLLTKKYSSYWRGDTGPGDAFDNCLSTMKLANSSLYCASPYYHEWEGETVLPVGQNMALFHAWQLEGVTMKNGEPMMIAEMWIGRKVYLAREVFNKAISGYGCGAYVLSTTEIDKIRPKTILEKLLDAYKNLLILLQAKQALLFPPNGH